MFTTEVTEITEFNHGKVIRLGSGGSVNGTGVEIAELSERTQGSGWWERSGHG